MSASPMPPEAGLAVHALRVRRGGRAVIADLSLAFGAGQLVAVIGPNGAGKSTLLGGVAGLLPSQGRVTWDGRPLRRDEIAFLPQASPQRATLSVFEVALLGRLDRLGWHVAEADVAAAAQALAALGLADLAERPIGTLSGGQQQLVLLAQQIARRPRLFILDEPTSALDLSRQLVVLDYLADYARTTGGVVIVALHDLSLAGRFADRLVLLRDGRVVASGTPEAVIRPDTIRAAYEVEAQIVRSAAGHPLVAPLHAVVPSHRAADDPIR